MSESLWTVEETAAYLNIATKTVRKWQMAGELPFIKLGGAVRFDPAEIRAWVKERAR